MTIKVLVAALALTASLTPAIARGACSGHDRQAQMSCADGKVWDSTSNSCITVGS